MKSLITVVLLAVGFGSGCAADADAPLASDAVPHSADAVSVASQTAAPVESDTTREHPPILMFTTEPVNAQTRRQDGTRVHSDIWAREFVRQGIILAAREEFGAATRDETLREPVEHDAADCIHIQVVAWEKGKIEFEISRDGVELYSTVIKLDLSLPSAYVPLVEQVEKLARTEIADALEQAGYPRRPDAGTQPAPVPEEILELLRQPNHVSQFAALRQLHRLHQQSPDSLPILGAITRAYAHLAQLTLPVLDLRHQVFGTRAVLYAQRMIALQPESPQGYWHRAYALSWIGYPNGGKADIERAAELAGEDHRAPEWVNLLDLYREFRFVELEQAASNDDSAEQPIAALIWFLASRMTASDTFTIETGRSALRITPHCLRIVSGMSEVAGVAYNHQLTALAPMTHREIVNEHLLESDDLPVQIADSLTADPQDLSMPRLISGLREAASNDRSEPSWHVLAGDIQAWNTQIHFQRARFLSYLLGVDAGDYVNESLPELRDDPFLQLFRTLGVPRAHQRYAYHKVLRDFRPPEMNVCSIGYEIVDNLPYEIPMAEGTLGDWRNQTWFGGMLLEDDCKRKMQFLTGETRLDLAKWLAQASKRAPLHFSARITLDWEKMEEEKRQWFGDEYARYPDVQWALAKGYKHAGEYEKSIEAYDKYLTLVEDANGYIGLAEAQYQSGDDESWLDTLSEALECRDYHLTHAVAAEHAAATLMHMGKFEEARPWAVRAAQSYSLSSVSCLIECLTALGELPEAEDLAKQMSERYQNYTWYNWCADVGAGDFDAAWKAKQERLNASYPPEHIVHDLTQAVHDLVLGNEQAARELLAQAMQRTFDPWNGMMLALLADRAGETELRDATLKRLAEDEQVTAANNAPFRELAVLFQHAVEAGALDLDEVSAALQAVAEEHGDWSVVFALYCAFYLDTHGEPDQALEQWKTVTRSTRMYVGQPLAWARLREAGIDPARLEGRRFPLMFVRPEKEKTE